MAEWRVESHTAFTGEYVATLPHLNLQFEVGFNGPRGYRFTLPVYHDLVTPETVRAGLQEIWIKRNDVVVAKGPLWDVVVSTTDGTISCSGAGLEDWLDVRLIGGFARTAVDPIDAIWDILEVHQAIANANYGIVRGHTDVAPSVSIEWPEKDQKYILEAVQDLSEVEDGFDWYIKPTDRSFNGYYPRLQGDKGLTLKYPEHIQGYAIQQYGKFLRNHIHIAGPDPWGQTASHPASQAAYRRRDYADTRKDAKHINELTAYASRIRDIRSEVKAYPTLVLRAGALDIFDTSQLFYGDKIKVIIQDSIVNMNEQQRYAGAQVTVSKNGTETIVLYTQSLRELT